jgi:hypothetical protein
MAVTPNIFPEEVIREILDYIKFYWGYVDTCGCRWCPKVDGNDFPMDDPDLYEKFNHGMGDMVRTDAEKDPFEDTDEEEHALQFTPRQEAPQPNSSVVKPFRLPSPGR